MNRMPTCPGYGRRTLRRIAGTALGAPAAGAALAQADTISDVPDSFGRIDAYRVEPQAADRARLVAYNGASEGSASGPNSRRRITLDTPLSEIITAAQPDRNDNLYQQRRDTAELLFRRSSGTGCCCAHRLLRPSFARTVGDARAFALNRQHWLNEKGAIRLASDFPVVPERHARRVEAAFANLAPHADRLMAAIAALNALRHGCQALMKHRTR
jgi:hypothetical protein